MTVTIPLDVEKMIRRAFVERASIQVIELTRRVYPDEVNFIVYVRGADIGKAAEVGNQLDSELSTDAYRAFIVVRKAANETVPDNSPARLDKGVQDDRATDLIRLISARSRVSLTQPSLSYLRDAPGNIATVSAARHQLIFGRRGAGKSALLVEARRIVSEEGAITAWANIQSFRHQERDRITLFIIAAILDALASHRIKVPPASAVASELGRLSETVASLIGSDELSQQKVQILYPRVQSLISRFLEIEGVPLYIFLDDFYYVGRNDQPAVLDGLHACVRDADAWLKISSIRRLSRWWQSSPPMGLQTTHDADTIDLDVTLQQPARAKAFLEGLLENYCHAVKVSSAARIFNSSSLDRLVLASGAVPRDYLTLAASSIVRAQGRENSRLVGVQDVNQAAGDAASEKLQELEEDMASNVGTAQRTLEGLTAVRNFCLQEESYTYFLVNYRDKELHSDLYSILTDLMDVRMIHLLDAGVSDAHAAGQRSEAYLLDLSQYSGSRFKQRIHVIDFKGGKIVARQTRSNADARSGDDPRKVIAIFRGAPTLELVKLQRDSAEKNQC